MRSHGKTRVTQVLHIRTATYTQHQRSMEQFALHRFPHDSRKEQHVLKRCAWQPGNQQLTNKLLATLTFNASGAHDVKLAAENTRLTANQLKAPFR